MSLHRPFPHAFETTLDLGSLSRRLLRNPVIPGEAADVGPFRAAPQLKAVAGFNDIPQAFAQTIALRVTASEETVNRVSSDAAHQTIERKFSGLVPFAKGTEPPQQLQHGLTREFGGVSRGVKETKPVAHDAAQYRRGIVDEEGFEDRFRIFVGDRGGEITLEKYLARHNIS